MIFKKMPEVKSKEDKTLKDQLFFKFTFINDLLRNLALKGLLHEIQTG